MPVRESPRRRVHADAHGSVCSGVGFGEGVDFAMPDRAAAIRLRRGPVWIRTLILYAVITALSLMRAAYIVRTPQRKLRTITRRRKDAPA